MSPHGTSLDIAAVVVAALYEMGDLENALLSEVDEDGAHEIATEFPEDETHDDDLDFAWERGPYDPSRVARFNDDSDGDLEFLYAAEHEAATLWRFILSRGQQ